MIKYKCIDHVAKGCKFETERAGFSKLTSVYKQQVRTENVKYLNESTFKEFRIKVVHDFSWGTIGLVFPDKMYEQWELWYSVWHRSQ